MGKKKVNLWQVVADYEDKWHGMRNWPIIMAWDEIRLDPLARANWQWKL